MSEATIRTAIYGILSGVTDIGKVYDYERFAGGDWAKFIGYFKTTIGTGEDAVTQIRGWEIGRKSVTEQKIVLGMGSSANELTHGFMMKGYLGVKDDSETEKTFNALIEAIATAFRADMKLGGILSEGHSFVQVNVIDTRIFGSVLCHYAELALTGKERV